MAEQGPNEPNFDILPRDQVEHYKIELARLRSENEHLVGEVDYLRQALAAALSKIPQIEAPIFTNSPADPQPPKSSASSSDPDPPPQDRHRPSENVASLRSYAGYFPLASLMASPVIFLIMVVLGLSCVFIFLSLFFMLS